MPSPAPAADTIDAKQLLQVLTRYKKGDFTTRMPVDRTGIAGKVYENPG